MSNKVFLGKPGIVSALGLGAEQHLSALLKEDGDFLTPSCEWDNHKTFYFGTIQETLRRFPDNLPDTLNSRNNQVLWTALEQIEDQIETVIERYGVHRVAVVMGTSTTGSEENKAYFKQFLGTVSQQVDKNGDISARTSPIEGGSFSQEKQSLSSPANFVQYVYGLKNLSYAISTACTSGARALISAARLLQLGLCDAVICGGVDTLATVTIQGFHSLEVLSASKCKPFATGRDGINIGEGAAVFVMTKNAANALPLLGYANSSDAYHMSSPRPDALGAKIAIEQALKKANLSAKDIQWVNLHGTGTIQNDEMESKAIVEVLGNVSSASTKSLTGHTLGAAGAIEAAFLWVVLSQSMNEKGYLPHHRYHQEKDINIAPIHLTQEGETFSSKARIALSTSFAFGGNNTVLILGAENV